MMLMSEKPSKSISVRELAERADINRGTFYIHYKDVSDLLQRLEDEMAERLIHRRQQRRQLVRRVDFLYRVRVVQRKHARLRAQQHAHVRLCAQRLANIMA